MYSVRSCIQMKIWFQVMSNGVFLHKMRMNILDIHKHLSRCIVSSEMAVFGAIVICSY